jgi:chlorinating enzyme
MGFRLVARKARQAVRRIKRWYTQQKRSVSWWVKRSILNNRQEQYQNAALEPLLNIKENSFSPSSVERDMFRDNGVLYPLTLCSTDVMSEISRYVRAFTLTSECPIHGYPHTKWRHIDDAVIYQLATHPAILDRVSQILGKNVLLWQSNLFDKPPGADEIPWHQDRLFLELEDGVNVSAWIALDDVDAANGCVEVIPGSHHQIIPAAKPSARRGTSSTAFGRMADPKQIDDSSAVNIELRAGEFMLFDEYLLHRSKVNSSGRQRLGLALRYTTPDAYITHQLDGFHSLLVRGKDTSGKNRLGLSPVRLSIR